MIYIIIGLILFSIIILYLISCKNSSSSNTQVSQQNENKTKVETEKSAKNPYEDIRAMALATTPEQLGLILPNDRVIVYGVIMDWDLSDGTATLATFQTGDASMYLSSGGGVMGGGYHENVKKEAFKFIEKAQAKVSKTVQTQSTPLPEKNSVKFYFLTNKGKFVAQEQMKNFENNSSEWLELFEEGNKVITELRIVGGMK